MAKKHTPEKMLMRVIRVAEILSQAQSCHDKHSKEQDSVVKHNYNTKHKTQH